MPASASEGAQPVAMQLRRFGKRPLLAGLLMLAAATVIAAPVSAQTVLSHLLANAETAKKIIVSVVPQMPTEPNWPEHFALDTALVTDRKLWPKATVEKLRPILARFL